MDKLSASPKKNIRKYELVLADFMSRIQSGEWKRGAKIPPIDELTKIYPYARMTVFNAVQEAINRGYLEARRGVGTFVSENPGTSCVGLVFGEDVLHTQETPVASMICRELRTYLGRMGKGVKLYVEHDRSGSAQLPEDLKDDLRSHRIVGLISAAGQTARLLENWPEWDSLRLPHVDFDHQNNQSHAIKFDTEAVLDIGLHYIRSQNKNKVGVIGLDTKSLESARQKLALAGMTTREEWMPVCTYKGNLAEQSGHEAMLDIWRTRKKPEAIIVMDDIMAKGVCQAALHHGLNIPKDLLLITHSNRDSGVFYPYPLPCIEFDIAECARCAGELLLDALARPDLPRQTRTVHPGLRMPDGLRIS
ncbi:MAG: substrate-binding domain-containing protein [Kiritimatiellia bacterium]